MRTPLSRVRGLGSARSGTGHFLQQRVTAISNLPLALFVVWLTVSLAKSDHAEAVSLLSSTWVVFGVLASLISMLHHMRLGMQVVIEDYIHGEGLKIALLLANTFFTLALGIIAGFSILKLGFGG